MPENTAASAMQLTSPVFGVVWVAVVVRVVVVPVVPLDPFVPLDVFVPLDRLELLDPFDPLDPLDRLDPFGFWFCEEFDESSSVESSFVGVFSSEPLAFTVSPVDALPSSNLAVHFATLS